ncbi:MAG: hypothetical protein AAGI91_02150 [Bacteroidota bacterium]
MLPRLVYIARIALVLAVVGSTQGLLLVQGTFLLRQDFVIENLCVNRSLPELDCEGTCFLTKQLHEQRQREKEEQQATMQIALAVAGVLAGGEPLPDRPVLQTAWAPVSVYDTGTDPAGRVFHPPRAV